MMEKDWLCEANNAQVPPLEEMRLLPCEGEVIVLIEFFTARLCHP